MSARGDRGSAGSSARLLGLGPDRIAGLDIPGRRRPTRRYSLLALTHNRTILSNRHDRSPGNSPETVQDGFPRGLRIGCVGFLNAKPLIHGLHAALPGAELHLDAPSALLDGLEDDRFDLALCPVIDAQRAATPLRLVPAGGIGCNGATLTVRLFADRPFDRVRTVVADPDSHTSVALLRCLWRARYGVDPRLVQPAADADPLDPLGHGAHAVLLIGDKVVPQLDRLPEAQQLDLGDAWKRHTGRPFVFATWMARQNTPLGDAPARLAALLDRNLAGLDALIDRYSAEHGWPTDLARQYVGEYLRYRVGPAQLDAIAAFYAACADAGVIDHVRDISVEPVDTPAPQGEGASTA